MKLINQFFQNYSLILDSRYKASSAMSNPTLLGDVREYFINDYLLSAFPHKYVFARGEIFDASSRKSGQADIVIYDEIYPLLSYGKVAHFLSAGVLSNIEIKSNLNRKKLEEAQEITSSIKKLDRNIHPWMTNDEDPQETKIPCMLFAYAGVKAKTLHKHLTSITKKYPYEELVDFICINKKLIAYKILVEGQGASYKVVETEENSLLYFSIRLYQYLYKSWAANPNISEYIENTNNIILSEITREL